MAPMHRPYIVGGGYVDLRVHVDVVKKKEIFEAWLTNAAKAIGIIAQGVKLQYLTKIRSATTA